MQDWYGEARRVSLRSTHPTGFTLRSTVDRPADCPRGKSVNGLSSPFRKNIPVRS
jgi:hypothetical protein